MKARETIPETTIQAGDTQSGTKKQRLESLDALRGLDLLFLVAAGPILRSMIEVTGLLDTEWGAAAYGQLMHVEWEGFSTWDLIMPLFMFMSGITIPFAYSRYRKDRNNRDLALKLVRRVGMLWIFGMIVQGNLLGLDADRIYLFSNTLQSIAIGYLGAVLLYVLTSVRTQVVTMVALLLTYWGAMEWISVDGFGGGDYTPGGNLAEWIDRMALGRFRDGASVANGVVTFLPSYHYTWILSSLTFTATVITGMLAGHIVRSKSLGGLTKVKMLVTIGAVSAIAGWLWGGWLPVIKTIWTSSMVAVSSGYCFMLMGVMYYWIDYKVVPVTCKVHKYTNLYYILQCYVAHSSYLFSCAIAPASYVMQYFSPFSVITLGNSHYTTIFSSECL